MKPKIALQILSFLEYDPKYAVFIQYFKSKVKKTIEYHCKDNLDIPFYKECTHLTMTKCTSPTVVLGKLIQKIEFVDCLFFDYFPKKIPVKWIITDSLVPLQYVSTKLDVLELLYNENDIGNIKLTKKLDCKKLKLYITSLNKEHIKQTYTSLNLHKITNLDIVFALDEEEDIVDEIDSNYEHLDKYLQENNLPPRQEDEEEEGESFLDQQQDAICQLFYQDQTEDGFQMISPNNNKETNNEEKNNNEEDYFQEHIKDSLLDHEKRYFGLLKMFLKSCDHLKTLKLFTNVEYIYPIIDHSSLVSLRLNSICFLNDFKCNTLRNIYLTNFDQNDLIINLLENVFLDKIHVLEIIPKKTFTVDLFNVLKRHLLKIQIDILILGNMDDLEHVKYIRSSLIVNKKIKKLYLFLPKIATIEYIMETEYLSNYNKNVKVFI